MCLNNDTNDNLMLFADQNQTLCESNEIPSSSGMLIRNYSKAWLKSEFIITFIGEN